MNEILGYYKNSGEKVNYIHESNYVQIKLMGAHAHKINAIMLISTNNLSLILEFTWYLGKSGYPVAYQSIDSKIKLGRGMKVYQMIMPKIADGYVIDHINRNKLDNRIENLRICTNKENSYNTSKPKNSKNKYKGVQKCGDKWKAVITKNNKTNEINNIASEKEAARIYDLMAEELFGKYAGKNFEN